MSLALPEESSAQPLDWDIANVGTGFVRRSKPLF
jgi:hypothetical protein